MALRTEATIAIVNLDTRERVSVMFVPKDVNWQAKSNWSVIPTMARNNPFYHYTGGEDKLSFELDWYAGDSSREDAIAAATKIKSWSRNNGYRNRPPRIMVIFGRLFRNHVFVLESAPYKMELFHRQKGVNEDLLPVQIYQTITLLKVTSANQDHAEISEGFVSTLITKTNG